MLSNISYIYDHPEDVEKALSILRRNKVSNSRVSVFVHEDLLEVKHLEDERSFGAVIGRLLGFGLKKNEFDIIFLKNHLSAHQMLLQINVAENEIEKIQALLKDTYPKKIITQ